MCRQNIIIHQAILSCAFFITHIWIVRLHIRSPRTTSTSIYIELFLDMHNRRFEVLNSTRTLEFISNSITRSRHNILGILAFFQPHTPFCSMTLSLNFFLCLLTQFTPFLCCRQFTNLTPSPAMARTTVATGKRSDREVSPAYTEGQPCFRLPL